MLCNRRANRGQCRVAPIQFQMPDPIGRFNDRRAVAYGAPGQVDAVLCLEISDFLSCGEGAARGRGSFIRKIDRKHFDGLRDPFERMQTFSVQLCSIVGTR